MIEFIDHICNNSSQILYFAFYADLCPLSIGSLSIDFTDWSYSIIVSRSFFRFLVLVMLVLVVFLFTFKNLSLNTWISEPDSR